jgi:hypothetical protein
MLFQRCNSQPEWKYKKRRIAGGKKNILLHFRLRGFSKVERLYFCIVRQNVGKRRKFLTFGWLIKNTDKIKIILTLACPAEGLILSYLERSLLTKIRSIFAVAN